MYITLLSLHSLFRWLVLASLLWSVYWSYSGVLRNSHFTKAVNSLRHWTATVAHIQLLIGILLYAKSPIIGLSIAANKGGLMSDPQFFRFFHLALMVLAVTVITIGSAKAKRSESDREKYRTVFRWFSFGLLLICLAIPWPFSPLASRPFFRPF